MLKSGREQRKFQHEMKTKQQQQKNSFVATARGFMSNTGICLKGKRYDHSVIFMGSGGVTEGVPS